MASMGAWFGARLPIGPRCARRLNVWVPPIRNRIDMLATGIKSPIGIKVAGTDLVEVNRVTRAIERAVKFPE